MTKEKNTIPFAFFLLLVAFPVCIFAYTGQARHTCSDGSSESRNITNAVSASELIEKDLAKQNIEVRNGCSVEYYTCGHDKFEALFEDIRNARSFIHLEYFNFRNDSIAGLMFQLLAEKARQGVEVRSMYDAFGNSSNSRPISKAMSDSINSLGIKLIDYDPIRFPWFNHIIPRDHRKIVVIDGRIAYSGGMNVADYYIKGIPEVGDWHDLHMRITGPAVNDFHHIFAGMWQQATGEVISGVNYFPTEFSGFEFYESMECGEEVCHITNHQDNHNSVATELAVIDRSAHHTPAAIRDLYVSMLNSAQHSVKLINPYFIPTHRVRQALKDAVDRGVDVQIILSAQSDIPLTPEGCHYVGNNLAKRGASVYLFHGGFHHTKMMIVDDEYCTVGSANLDARSLRCDYEVNTLILGREATQEMVRHFEAQKASSTKIEKGYWRTRSWGKQFQGWFANLLTPVL